ncbi:IS21 family transposase [Dyella kyungheensis]|uniref:IS21 family transposase n=1 Tax=Dyella kyungheensis TaxID=1242174 RepID=UPI003CF44A16
MKKHKAKAKPSGALRATLHLITQTRFTDRDIAQMETVKLGKSSISRYRHLLHEKQLSWSDLEDLSDQELHALLKKTTHTPRRTRQPDWEWVHQELNRKPKPNTKFWIWRQYRKEDASTAMSYSHFTVSLNAHFGKDPDAVMRKVHLPGHVVEVDYSGDSYPYVDPATGQKITPALFVGVLPATSYAFAFCTPGQTGTDWIAAHVRMFEHFGGLPFAVRPDNASGIMARPRRPGEDGKARELFEDFLRAYDLALDPARVRKPRDKGAVEGTVGYVQNYVLANLRDRVFHSLDELNAALAIEVAALNNEIMQHYKRSRQQRFLEDEKTALRPLPAQRYAFVEYVELPPVPPNYCVPIRGHFYSVPHQLIGKRLCARLTDHRIEILHERTVVARHTINRKVGGATILDEHRPPAHLAESRRNPDGLMAWAKEEGGAILAFFQHHYGKWQPYIAMSKCQGLQNLVRKHGAARVHRACQTALDAHTYTVTDVTRLLSEEL